MFGCVSHDSIVETVSTFAAYVVVMVVVVCVCLGVGKCRLLPSKHDGAVAQFGCAADTSLEPRTPGRSHLPAAVAQPVHDGNCAA